MHHSLFWLHCRRKCRDRSKGRWVKSLQVWITRRSRPTLKHKRSSLKKNKISERNKKPSNHCRLISLGCFKDFVSFRVHLNGTVFDGANGKKLETPTCDFDFGDTKRKKEWLNLWVNETWPRTKSLEIQRIAPIKDTRRRNRMILHLFLKRPKLLKKTTRK